MAFDELKSPFCTDCDLSKKCHTPEIKPIGPEKADIYILGEAPSERDDLIGKPFSGQGGEIFRTILEHLKIGPAKVRFGNAIQCKADKEGPTDIQINMCRKRVFADIKKAKPKVIIAMGNAAIKSLLNRSEPGVHGWRGNIVPLHDLNCWVVPVFPMSKILKDGVSDNKIQWTKGTNYTDSLKVLREDLSIVRDLTTVPLPKIKPFKIIKLLTYQAVTSFFDMADNKDFFMFDIETIGLKPYFEHSKILTSAVTFDGETVYAFPISYHTYIDKKKYWTDEQEKQIKSRFSDLLINPRSRKGIHNSVFEMEWAKAIAQMQFDGACTNEESRDRLLKGYVIERENTEKELLSLDSVIEFKNKYGKVPALKSNSKDIPIILFQIENLDSIKKTKKSGKPAVDKEVLASYVGQSRFCELLLKFREYSGIEGKILKGYTDCVFPDKKYHTNFYPIETGRLGSSSINLQNLDKRKHPEIRQIIVAPEGYVLIIFDYAQLEARVLAALSNCRKLIDAIKTGYDIHMVKAVEIWGQDVINNATKSAVKSMRYRAKNEFVFPSFYGSKPISTAKRLGISESKAELLLEKLWNDFPEILEWQQEILELKQYNFMLDVPLVVEGSIGFDWYETISIKELFE